VCGYEPEFLIFFFKKPNGQNNWLPSAGAGQLTPDFVFFAVIGFFYLHQFTSTRQVQQGPFEYLRSFPTKTNPGEKPAFIAPLPFLEQVLRQFRGWNVRIFAVWKGHFVR